MYWIYTIQCVILKFQNIWNWNIYYMSLIQQKLHQDLIGGCYITASIGPQLHHTSIRLHRFNCIIYVFLKCILFSIVYCVWALSPLGPSGYFRVPDPPPNRGETPHVCFISLTVILLKCPRQMSKVEGSSSWTNTFFFSSNQIVLYQAKHMP